MALSSPFYMSLPPVEKVLYARMRVDVEGLVGPYTDFAFQCFQSAEAGEDWSAVVTDPRTGEETTLGVALEEYGVLDYLS